MNPNAQFERDLEQWLQAEAPASAPAGFHASVMDRARTLRQRPGWSTPLPLRRLGRGRGMTLLAAAALLGGGALAAGSGILRLPSVVPPVPSPSVFAVATASPEATDPSPSESVTPSASPIPVAGPGGAWTPTGSMGTARSRHAAVRLLDGRVLVVGGDAADGGDQNPSTAELYDPASGMWSATGTMLEPQGGFPPTLLLDGRVLVGHIDEPAKNADDVSTIGAEVYDPERGTWTATGKMVNGAAVWAADFGSSATLLRDGKVLVAGQGGTQVYDPQSGAWSPTGPMITPRHGHTATLLGDGTVLVVGGADGGDRPLGSAELYDPETRSWTAIESPYAIRDNCPGCRGVSGLASLLQDGTVLLMRYSTWDEFEPRIYDPATGAWSAPTAAPQSGGPAALLPNDTVLMTGLDKPDGAPASCTATALYDPRSGSWTTASSMLRCANDATFTPLVDGTVLVAGGSDCDDDGVCVPTGAAELYVPAGVALPPFSFPSPPPAVFPSPTPRPTPLPPAAGPVPPNARSWKVTVDNRSSEPATLFVAEEGEGGMLRLVGSASPNVVPAGATAKVTFLFPAKGGPDDGWIYVNPRPGEGGSLVNADQIGIPGKILIGAEGNGGWLSP